MFSALLAVREVQSYLKAKKRIPDDQKNTAPYSANALWTYYNRTDHKPKGDTCNYCQMFDGQTFTGAQLRSVFPDHEWKGNDIYPNVHKTLWGKDSTCACLLIRDSEPDKQVNLNMWSSMGIDWTEEPAKPVESESAKLISESEQLRKQAQETIEKLRKRK